MRGFGILVVAIGVVVSLASASPESAGVSQSIPAASEESMASLVREVQLLRTAIERASVEQKQVQAMMVYASASQSRLVQLASRADSASSTAVAAKQRLETEMSAIGRMEDALKSTGRYFSPEERRDMEDVLVAVKQSKERLEVESRDADRRSQQMQEDLQASLAHWNDLMGRLDSATR